MRIGLDIAQQRMPWDELVDRVRFAEDLGFHGAWGFDHFEPMYGEGPGETFEGMTTLAALAGLTSRIRLGLLVTGVTYRHPSVLAAQALTVDHASHGRLELALGAAWFHKEHAELGIPFPPTGERFDLLGDALEIVTRLFTGDVVSYEGARVSLQGAQMRPLPVQRPHPPIWIGGTGPRRTLPWWRGTPTSGTRGARRARSARRTPGSTSWRRPPAATRARSCGPARSRWTTWTAPGATAPTGGRPATGTWCAGGPARGGRRWRRSPATSCPSSRADPRGPGARAASGRPA